MYRRDLPRACYAPHTYMTASRFCDSQSTTGVATSNSSFCSLGPRPVATSEITHAYSKQTACQLSDAASLLRLIALGISTGLSNRGLYRLLPSGG